MQKHATHRITSRVEVCSSNTYYVWRNDTEFGPYTIHDIRQYWSAQTLTPSDYIRESHSADWIDASAFMLPLLTSDKTHLPEPEPAPAASPVVQEIRSKMTVPAPVAAPVPATQRDGELGWGVVSVLAGLGGLTAAYFANTHLLLTLTLWLVCLALGVGGWLFYHSRSQLVLSLLFLAAIGLGVWPTSATSQTQEVPKAVVMNTRQSSGPGPGTLLGSSPTEPTQTWTSLTPQLPGITGPVSTKVEATPAADLPPMPDTQTTTWTDADR